VKVVKLRLFSEARRVIVVNPTMVTVVQAGPFAGTTRVRMSCGVGHLVVGKREEVCRKLFGKEKR